MSEENTNTIPVKYDAFISYRHCPFDSCVAAKLHKKLEHYHIPRIIRQLTGRKKISRIFRDKEELPLSSNLTQNIYDALDHSEYLILICSPESKASLWVQREVSYFIEKHGREHVLAVVVKGEPDDVFPEILCEDIKYETDEKGNLYPCKVSVEPLAADIRAATQKQSLRKLHSEILRLLAAMLGCPYDALKQRHRQYMLKRTSIALSSLLLLFLCIGGYSQYQKRQIFEQKQISLQNQSEYLSEQSVTALKAGRRTEALQKAIQLSSLEDENHYATPQQMYALNTALYSYKTNKWLDFAPLNESDVDNLSSGAFSEDGEFYYAVSENFEGYVFSGKTGKLLWNIDTETIKDNLSASNSSTDSPESTYSIRKILPYQDHTFLVILDYVLCIMDTDSHEVLHAFPVTSSNTNILGYDLQNNILCICADDLLYMYDLKTTDRILERNILEILGFDPDDPDVPTTSFPIINNVPLVVDTSRTEIVFGLSWAKDYPSVSDGLWIYDYQNNSVRVLDHCQTDKLLLINKNKVAAIQHQIPKDQRDGIGGMSYYTYYVTVYDTESEKAVYTGEKTTLLQPTDFGIISAQDNTSEPSSNLLVSWFDKQIQIIDIDAKVTCGQLNFDSRVLNVSEMNDGRFLVGTHNGTIQLISVSDMILRSNCMQLDQTLDAIYYDANIMQFVELANGKAIFSSITCDPHMKESSISDNDATDITISSIKYIEQGTQIYRCVNCDTVSSTIRILIYDNLTDNCIYTYNCTQQDHSIQLYDLFEKDGNTWLYVLEKDSAFGTATALHMINLANPTETINIELSSLSISAYTATFNSDGSKLVCEADEKLTVFSLSDASIQKDGVLTGLREVTCSWQICKPSDTLIFATQPSYDADNSNLALSTYDLSSGTMRNLDVSIPVGDTLQLITGIKNALVCVYNGITLYNIDFSTGQIISEIDAPEETPYTTINVSFFREDTCLLITIGNTILLYQFETGNLLDSFVYISSDTALSASNTLDLVTDSDPSYFALKDVAFRGNHDTANSNKHILYVFYVDESYKIYPYAEVNYGYTSLAGREIAVKSQSGSISYAPYYDYATLKKWATSILEDD